MPYIGKQSRSRLDTCHADLQKVCEILIEHYDFSVVWGHRGEGEQNAAYARKASKKPWPHSKHNGTPSLAVDLAPYPRLYEADVTDFSYMAGMFMVIAAKMGVDIRWGGDFNENQRTEDGWDWGHFELTDPS